MSASQAHLDKDKQFVLLDDEDDDADDEGDEGEEGDAVLDEDGENEVDDRDVSGYVSLSLISPLIFSCVRVLIESLIFQIQCGKCIHR